MKDIKILFGKRVKEIRTARNMTQENLADKLGVEQKNISCIERGITFPSQNLIKLADALDATIAELLDFEHHKYSTAEMKAYICKNLDYISEHEVLAVFRFVKAMI